MAYVITKNGAIALNENGERPITDYNAGGKPEDITEVDNNGPKVLHRKMYPTVE